MTGRGWWMLARLALLILGILVGRARGGEPGPDQEPNTPPDSRYGTVRSLDGKTRGYYILQPDGTADLYDPSGGRLGWQDSSGDIYIVRPGHPDRQDRRHRR